MDYRRLCLLTLLVPLCSGCASIWPGRNGAPSEAELAVQRKAEMVASFEVKRDQAQFEAAMIRWREGDTEGCRELVDKLLLRTPKHRGARMLRAEFRLVEDQPEVALADIQRLVDENPSDAEAAHLLGLLLEASGRGPDSLAHFEQATELAPDNQVFRSSYQNALIGEPMVRISDNLSTSEKTID